MNDYKSLDNKMVFSQRMEEVFQEVSSRYRGYFDKEDGYTSVLSRGNRNPFADQFESDPEAPYVINFAKAIVRSWMETPCIIQPSEALVGVPRPHYPLMEHFSWGILIDEDQCYDEDDPYENADAEVERCKAFMEKFSPLTEEYIHDAAREFIGKERYNVLSREDFMWGGGYQGHTIPNYYTLLGEGLDNMLTKIDYWAEKNAKDQDTADFYEANRIIVRGMSSYLQMYADYAADLLAKETDETKKLYYKQIAENCAFVAHKKPETLYQAVQLMWCLALWDWVDCWGRMDQYLYPFYQKAVAEGDVIPAEDSIVSIMMKAWEHGVHNITVGGVYPETGEDATNEISYMVLQCIRVFHNIHPRVTVRIHENTPANILDLVVKLWSEGMSDPTVVSDKTVIRGLTDINIPLNDARDFSILGCQEIEIPGKSNTGCEDGSFNVAKVVELAIYGGKATRSPDYQLGPKTPSLVECKTFEEFYDAFVEQLKFFVSVEAVMCDAGQKIRAIQHSKLVKGVFTDGVLESGKNHDDGGPIYNHGCMETAGIAAASDSLLAIKKIVFDEKKMTAEKLVEALKANFKGFEKERQMLLNYVPKFGNDIDEADDMAVKVLNLFWDEMASYKSIRGEAYTGACSLLGSGTGYGMKMGAMPDGRFKGEPLNNSMGPRTGADKSGLTAMLNSVAKLPLHKGVGGTTLNVVITKKMLATPEQRKNIAATMKAYLMNGGQLAQITTANLDELLDAREHPERHGNLIVRIGGYSIHFVEMMEHSQLEMIARYSSEEAQM